MPQPRLPLWLNLAVSDCVVTQEQAQELAVLERSAAPGTTVEVPEHLRPATRNLWLWEAEPANELPV